MDLLHSSMSSKLNLMKCQIVVIIVGIHVASQVNPVFHFYLIFWNILPSMVTQGIVLWYYVIASRIPAIFQCSLHGVSASTLSVVRMRTTETIIAVVKILTLAATMFK